MKEDTSFYGENYDYMFAFSFDFADKGSQMVRNCSVSNGGCEQNCTNLPNGGYYCYCRTGFKVSTQDRKTCDGMFD